MYNAFGAQRYWLKSSIYPYDMETMQRLGENSSLAERRADEATRDVVNWLEV